MIWTDPAERGRALGIWAGCNGLAFALGPTLGGLLIEGFGWRSVFLIVLPVDALACVLAWRSVPESADPKGRSFDLGGQVLGALALGGLALAAIEGREAPRLLVVVLPLAVVATALFLWAERQQGEAALVPLDLSRQRASIGAVAATAAMTFGMYGLLFLVPLSWQGGASGAAALTPVEAGLGLRPMALAFVLASSRSGALVHRVGARATTAGGTALIGAGLLVMALTEAGRPMSLAQTGLLLAGIGMGVNTAPLMGGRRRRPLGAFRHGVGADQRGAYGRGDAGSRGAGSALRAKGLGSRRTHYGDVGRGIGAAHGRRRRVGHDPQRGCRLTGDPTRTLRSMPTVPEVGIGGEVHLPRRQIGKGEAPAGRCSGRERHLGLHGRWIVEAVRREADVRTANLAVAERRSACGAEAPLDAVRAREHARRRGPLHLVCREANEGHERGARGFLTHAAITDGGPVPRPLGAVADPTALAATIEVHEPRCSRT